MSLYEVTKKERTRNEIIQVTKEVILARDVEILFKTIIYSLQGMIMLSFSSSASLNRRIS